MCTCAQSSIDDDAKTNLLSKYCLSVPSSQHFPHPCHPYRRRRLLSNSLPASFNLSYDHGDYRERVDHNKDFFEKMQLKKLYQDKSLTGGF